MKDVEEEKCWSMAGSVKNYAGAAKRYRVCAACGVGMGKPEHRQRAAIGNRR